jgi:hypothetical protein
MAIRRRGPDALGTTQSFSWPGFSTHDSIATREPVSRHDGTESQELQTPLVPPSVGFAGARPRGGGDVGTQLLGARRRRPATRNGAMPAVQRVLREYSMGLGLSPAGAQWRIAREPVDAAHGPVEEQHLRLRTDDLESTWLFWPGPAGRLRARPLFHRPEHVSSRGDWRRLCARGTDVGAARGMRAAPAASPVHTAAPATTPSDGAVPGVRVRPPCHAGTVPGVRGGFDGDPVWVLRQTTATPRKPLARTERWVLIVAGRASEGTGVSPGELARRPGGRDSLGNRRMDRTSPPRRPGMRGNRT